MAINLLVSAHYDGRDIDRAMAQLKRMEREVGTVGGRVSKGMGRMSSGMKSALTGFAGGMAAGLVSGGLMDIAKAAQESVKVSKVTEAQLKATGNAAGVTADDINSMATALSNKTAIDDEQIQSASNLLLAFTNVRNAGEGQAAMFDRATASALDMSVAGFGSVESAAKVLGKALNDPTKATGVLRKAGVQLTAQQQEQIKTLTESGDTLGAQAIIMGAVEQRFAGVAEAAADPVARLGVASENLKEQIGLALLPTIEVVSKALAAFAGWASENTELVKTLTTVVLAAGAAYVTLKGALAVVRTVQAVTAAVRAGAIAQAAWNATFTASRVVVAGWAAAQKAALIVSRAWIVTTNAMRLSTLRSVAALVLERTTMLASRGAMLAVAAAQGIATAAQWAWNVALTANPIGVVVMAIAALVAAFVIAYKKSDTFRRVVDGALRTIANTAGRMFTVLKVGFAAWLKVLATVGPFVLRNFYRPVVGAFLSLATSLTGLAAKAFGWVPGIGDKVRGAHEAVVGFARGVDKTITGMADTLSTKGNEWSDKLLGKKAAAKVGQAAGTWRKAGRAQTSALARGLNDPRAAYKVRMAAIAASDASVPEKAQAAKAARRAYEASKHMLAGSARGLADTGTLNRVRRAGEKAGATGTGGLIAGARSGMDNARDYLTRALSGLGDRLRKSDYIKRAGATLGGGFGTSLTGALTTGMRAVRTKAAGLIAGLRTHLAQRLPAFRRLGLDLVGNMAGGMRDKLRGGLTTAANKVISALVDVGSRISRMWQQFRNAGADLIEALKAGWDAAWRNVKAGMSSVIQWILDKIGSVSPSGARSAPAARSLAAIPAQVPTPSRTMQSRAAPVTGTVVQSGAVVVNLSGVPTGDQHATRTIVNDAVITALAALARQSATASRVRVVA